jgi:hypothetical protein
MRVARAQQRAVLRGQRRDPQVVRWDRRSLPPQLPVQAGELEGGLLVGE